MNLTETELADYNEFLAKAKEDNVHIVHSFNKDNPKGGYTFAWIRDNPFSLKGKMIRVAVTFCSDKDSYCRKIGAFQALTNLYCGESILLPIGNPSASNVSNVLRTIFDHSQDAYS